MGNKPKRKRTTTTTKTRTAAAAEDPGKWKRRIIWIVSAAVGGLLILFIIADQPEQAEVPAGVQSFIITDAGHTNDRVAYEQDPPVGGAHAPVWQNCGFYSAPIASEAAVHAMEHGVVWITYRPDLPEDDLDKLRDFAREPEVLVSPYPGLDVPVSAQTWGNQMRFQSVDDPDLEDFVIALKNGPGTPEPAAGCTGGTSATVG